MTTAIDINTNENISIRLLRLRLTQCVANCPPIRLR